MDKSRSPLRPVRGRIPRQGQTVLAPPSTDLTSDARVEMLFRLSDPALSELELDEFLDELLVRVRDAVSADTVAILLFDDETQQLVARAAKGIEEEVEQGVRLPIGHGFAGRIAAERVPIFIADVDHADILNPLLRQRGIRSLLGIPLIVEGSVIGVLHVGSLTPRVFDERDVAILQVAAARAAPAIEQARLSEALEHEHRVAATLQRNLLPKKLDEVVGVTSAARYLPASDEVGGDWYDLFELRGGKLGLAIGDVAGHGLRAAALMGQLRTALHAYAIEGHSPGQTLGLVDRFLQDMPEFGMSTGAYALLDPDTGEVQLASAGHLPPIIVGSGKARMLEVEPAPPLGVVPYRKQADLTFTLEPGETLLLYTDGLVELPGILLDQTLEELLAMVAPARSADDVCQLAVGMLPLQRLRDDVAILAVRREPVPAELALKLPADAKVLADVRRSVRRWLRSIGADDATVGEVTIAANEACANAIEHAYSPAAAAFHLDARTRDGEITIVVRDSGQWRSPRGQNRGRGLAIIETAMDAVEMNRSDQGTEITMRRRLR